MSEIRYTTPEKIKWDQLKLYCPNCGEHGLWVMVDRKGTYPSFCEKCRESCVIDPWHAFDIHQEERHEQ